MFSRALSTTLFSVSNDILEWHFRMFMPELLSRGRETSTSVGPQDNHLSKWPQPPPIFFISIKWIIPYEQRPSFIPFNDVPPVFYKCLIPIILMHLLSLYNINTYPPPPKKNFKKKRVFIDHSKYIQLIFFFRSELPSELSFWITKWATEMDIFFLISFHWLVQVQNMLNIAF